jgi:hypothetical protein
MATPKDMQKVDATNQTTEEGPKPCENCGHLARNGGEREWAYVDWAIPRIANESVYDWLSSTSWTSTPFDFLNKSISDYDTCRQWLHPKTSFVQGHRRVRCIAGNIVQWEAWMILDTQPDSRTQPDLYNRTETIFMIRQTLGRSRLFLPNSWLKEVSLRFWLFTHAEPEIDDNHFRLDFLSSNTDDHSWTGCTTLAHSFDFLRYITWKPLTIKEEMMIVAVLRLEGLDDSCLLRTLWSIVMSYCSGPVANSDSRTSRPWYKKIRWQDWQKRLEKSRIESAKYTDINDDDDGLGLSLFD